MTGATSDAVFAIDIGGSKLLTGIVDVSGAVIECVKAPLGSHVREDELVSLIGAHHRMLRDLHPDIRLRCAGAAVPALADSARGIWILAPASGIRDFPIGPILSHSLGMPVFIENDVTACAKAEMVFGSCRGTDHFIWITISNGIGGGLVLNRTLYTGATHAAGEIGHCIVVENGVPCGCGHRGCLEAYAAGPGICRRYVEQGGTRPGGAGEARVVAEAAREGEGIAREVFRQTGRYLGMALSQAVNLLNPQKVILGGGVAQAIDLFLPEVRSTMRERVFQEANPMVSVEQTALGYDAALLGAASIALERIAEVCP